MRVTTLGMVLAEYGKTEDREGGQKARELLAKIPVVQGKLL